MLTVDEPHHEVHEKLKKIQEQITENMDDVLFDEVVKSLLTIKKRNEKNTENVDACISYLQKNKKYMNALVVACFLNGGIVFSDDHRSIDDMASELFADLSYLSKD
jgi:hypothetical protein